MASLLRRKRMVLALAACGMIALGPSAAAAQAIGYSVSVNGVRGTYPGTRLDSLYVFNGVDVVGGPVRLAVAVPWMRIKTTPSEPGGAVVPALSSTTSGLGDPFVRFDVRVLDDRVRALQVGVAGSVKLPVVAASTGRGTGERDYAVGANVYKAMNRTSLMADVLFWKVGDPEGLDFSDTWSYSFAAAQLLGDGRWSAFASVAGLSAGSDGMPAPVALSFSVMRLLARGQSLAVTASFGLNDGSSDFSVGVNWRIVRRQL